MRANSHPRQKQRLQVLRSYGVLDTDAEDDFDDIVSLASNICGTPISVINLIDEDRQWFKAEVGLNIRETPLETSFCAHAILEEELMEIEDIQSDPRMADNPLCMGDEGFRFYAGALLRTAEGLPLGTLCVLDRRPRILSFDQRHALRVLARQVMAQLNLRRELEASRIFRLEVDHRVKNSLQSLSSLARLQLRGLQDPEAIEAVSSIKSRIDAISVLHELLYKTEASGDVDLGGYLTSICAQLSRLAPPRIRIVPKLDSVYVTSQQAVATGTLVNELILNSLKHAFRDSSTGTITISVSQNEDLVTVTCQDDGRGANISALGQSGGHGMKIAQIAAAELGTKIVFCDGHPGMKAQFAFTPGS